MPRPCPAAVEQSEDSVVYSREDAKNTASKGETTRWEREWSTVALRVRLGEGRLRPEGLCVKTGALSVSYQNPSFLGPCQRPSLADPQVTSKLRGSFQHRAPRKMVWQFLKMLNVE